MTAIDDFTKKHNFFCCKTRNPDLLCDCGRNEAASEYAALRDEVEQRRANFEIMLSRLMVAEEKVVAIRAESERFKKSYYDLADAIAPESSSTQMLIDRVRTLRAENERLKAQLDYNADKEQE